jgi:hypothetical protein
VGLGPAFLDPLPIDARKDRLVIFTIDVNMSVDQVDTLDGKCIET